MPISGVGVCLGAKLPPTLPGVHLLGVAVHTTEPWKMNLSFLGLQRLSSPKHRIAGSRGLSLNQRKPELYIQPQEGSETTTLEKRDSTVPPGTSLKFLNSLSFIYVSVR